MANIANDRQPFLLRNRLLEALESFQHFLRGQIRGYSPDFPNYKLIRVAEYILKFSEFAESCVGLVFPAHEEDVDFCVRVCEDGHVGTAILIGSYLLGVF